MDLQIELFLKSLRLKLRCFHNNLFINTLLLECLGQKCSTRLNYSLLLKSPGFCIDYFQQNLFPYLGKLLEYEDEHEASVNSILGKFSH